MSKKPHIVIFNPDQWRGDVLHHTGNDAAVTPTLDRLAETEAVSFRNAFCQNPVCTPSRCSFMSGWYPHVRGHRSMARMLRSPDENNLLRTLKDAGYFVWWGGKNDLVPGQHGFEEVCDVKYSSGYWRIHDESVEQPRSLYASDRDWTTDPDYYSFYRGKLEKGEADYYRDYDWANVEGAIEAIRNHDGEKPLCIFLALAYPHPPYCVEEPWFSMIDRDSLPPRRPVPEDWSGRCAFEKAYYERQGLQDWTEEQWNELRATYYGMAARTDHQLGLVIDALKEAGMYDDTALFFFPDHGDWTGDYGLVEKHQICFEDPLTNVPFVVKPPKDIPVKPRVSDALVELIDFPATVEAMAGVTLPHPHFGRSLLPVLCGETDEHRDAVFTEGGALESETNVPYADGGAPGKPVQPDHQYYAKTSLQQERIEYIGKAVMLRTKTHKLIKRLYDRDELYDLRADPMEMTNVIDDPAQAQVKAALEDRMLQYYLETGDVVLNDRDKRE
jgi:arylsulfatase A-like enzyme